MSSTRFRIADALGILALHASAVIADGNVLLFLGPSGAGKTTICRVLGACVQPLADDAVYLIPRAGGEWLVAGADGRTLIGPLFKEEAATLDGPPLYAVFRLYQAQTSHLEQVEHLETGRYLTDAFFGLKRNWYLTFEARKAAFASLAMIARAIRGYRFYFDQSSRTVEAITGKIGLNCPDDRRQG